MQGISFHNRRVYQSYLHIFPFASRLSYIELFGKMNVIIWGSSGHEIQTPKKSKSRPWCNM